MKEDREYDQLSMDFEDPFKDYTKPYEVIVRFMYRASRSRAMPETEKPPAMPEDIYFQGLSLLSQPFSFQYKASVGKIPFF